MYFMVMYIMLTISVVLTAIVNNCDKQRRLNKQPIGQFKKVSYIGWLLCTSIRHPKRLGAHEVITFLFHFTCKMGV